MSETKISSNKDDLMIESIGDGEELEMKEQANPDQRLIGTSDKSAVTKDEVVEIDHDKDDPLIRCSPVFEFFDRISPLQAIIYMRLTLQYLYKRHKTKIKITLLLVLCLLWFLYLGMAFSHRFGDEPSMRLLVLTALAILGILYHFTKKFMGRQVREAFRPIYAQIHRYRKFITFILTIAVGCTVVLFIIIDTFLRRPESLISAVGLIVIVTATFFCSKDPRKVTWRPVLWGMLLQLIFGLIVLRTRWGYDAFDWLGDRVTEYLDHANAGAKFVFGQNFMEHFFAFQVMSVLVFFSSTIGILYYLGVIQVTVQKVGFIMEFSLGTGAMESLHAAANIFLGWAEAITMIRPLMPMMTLSELHTVMTNGFATVAGSTLAIYILYGASANHLLAASVMSAPAALALSKLMYPEAEMDKRKEEEKCKIPKLGSGIIDAASIGAVAAISLVSYILASVIAFISLLQFVNSSLQWFGDRVGLIPPNYPPLTFELICSYLFWPLVFLMGVHPSDCRIVARMVGIKTFINEFIAYEDLGRVKGNREKYESLMGVSSQNGSSWIVDGSSNWINKQANVTLIGGVVSPHSEMITTYALCGFSNIVALGIAIGAYAAAAPARKSDITKVAWRALITGCMACFMTACIAGLLGEG